MRTRLEIVSKLVEDKHITFEEGLMLMETVKHPLTNFPQHGIRSLTSDPILDSPGSTSSSITSLLGPTDEYR